MSHHLHRFGIPPVCLSSLGCRRKATPPRFELQHGTDNVWAFAYVTGKKPEREWLVYGFAPRSARTNLKVQIPGYGPVTLTATQSGSYTHVDESAKTAKTIVQGGPASVRLEVASQVAEAGKDVTFAALDPFNPEGVLDTFAWDLGDGTKKQGPEITHTYAKPGLFLATLTASDAAGTAVSRVTPMFVDLPPEEGLVLSYPMDQAPTEVLHDASGRRNIGLLKGGVWVEDPQKESVLELDGKAQHAIVLNSPDINSQREAVYTSRTLLLSFRPNATTGRQTLYEEGGSGSGMNLYLDGTSLYAGIWRTEVWKGSWVSLKGIEAGKWYSAAVVLREAEEAVRPAKMELYLNGQKVASGRAAQLTYHPGDINIGRNGNTVFQDGPQEKPGNYFAGRIDDLRIYSRALTQAELAGTAGSQD